MIEVIRAASEVQAVCEGESWRFCFIGGLALQRWGEPRETVDVDLTLLTGSGGEEPFIAHLLQKFQSRIANAAEFARDARAIGQTLKELSRGNRAVSIGPTSVNSLGHSQNSKILKS